MSDTLPASAHRVNSSGNCSISGCPCRGWSAQETASVKEVNNQPPTPALDISSLLDQLRTQLLEVVKERDELREVLRQVREACNHRSLGVTGRLVVELIPQIDAALNDDQKERSE